jgi:hypothetical protein
VEGRAKTRWIHRFASSISMPNNCCQFWSEKQREVRSTGATSVDVCADGSVVLGEALACGRQRPPQFPLRPYS